MEQPKQPEDEVAELFRAAGHALTESVGTRPGEVWRFAQPTTGFVRPRTLWRVWPQRPEDWSAALEALEQARLSAGADRALAVLWEGALPEGCTTDLERPSTAITLRRLALQLADVPRLVREALQGYEREEGPKYFLRRRGVVDGELVDDMAAYIVQWSQSDDPRALVLEGDEEGTALVVMEAAYRVGQMFLADPEHVRPMFPDKNFFLYSRVPSARYDWVSSTRTHDVLIGRPLPPGRMFGSPVEVISRYGSPESAEVRVVAQLSPVAYEDVRRWYDSWLPASLADLLMEAYHENTDLAALLGEASLLPAWMSVLPSAPLRPGDSTAKRSATAIVQLFEHVGKLRRDMGHGMMWSRRWKLGAVGEIIGFGAPLLEDAALEDFALQRRTLLSEVASRETGTWLRLVGIRGGDDPGFANTLVRDYFLARKIIREVRDGRRDILTRYQFPREHVLLFLAILSPESAALASEDRIAAMRAEIERQAEEEVQLVLAHHLKRSAGAIRAYMDALEEHLPVPLPPEAEQAVGGVYQEVDYLRRLADRTRRLYQIPAAEFTDLQLLDILNAVAGSMRQYVARARLIIQVDGSLRVHGNRDSLEEIFSCLLENAFHAVAFDQPDPQVRVVAFDEGATVRVDVVDSGAGIPPEARESIFNPRVTTKKGGKEGRPIGTGMGLPIARKFAEAIGGRVELDPEANETTFFVRLVKVRQSA